MKFGELARVASGDLWILPRYWEYLSHRNVDAEYQMLAGPMHRPERIRENNWSASSAGRCLREQQLTYLGFTKIAPDEKMGNIFANGDYVHLRHQAFGLVAGYITEVEVPVRLPQWKLRGTMDGMLSNGQGLEIKSINPFGFDRVKSFGPQDKHVLQVHAYMLARPDIEAFRILYENKADNLCKEFLVPRDPVLIGQVEEHLAQLNRATEQRKLLPMLQGCKNEEGSVFRQCPYRSVCPDAEYPVKPVIRRSSRKRSLAKSS